MRTIFLLSLMSLACAVSADEHLDGIKYETALEEDNSTLKKQIDPRDMAEVRVFYEDHFLCRAICPELAGETITSARQKRKRQLRETIQDRRKAVDQLLKLKGGIPPSWSLSTRRTDFASKAWNKCERSSASWKSGLF